MQTGNNSAMWVMLGILIALVALVAFMAVRCRPRVYLAEGLVLLFVSLIPATLAAPAVHRYAQPDPVLQGLALLILTVLTMFYVGLAAGFGTAVAKRLGLETIWLRLATFFAFILMPPGMVGIIFFALGLLLFFTVSPGHWDMVLCAYVAALTPLSLPGLWLMWKADL